MRPPILLDLPDTIDTDRLRLRPPMAGDGPAINAAILDTWEALHQWMPWARERPTTEQSEQYAREARAAFLARSKLPMLMLSREDATLIGGTGLHGIDWGIVAHA